MASGRDIIPTEGKGTGFAIMIVAICALFGAGITTAAMMGLIYWWVGLLVDLAIGGAAAYILTSAQLAKS